MKGCVSPRGKPENLAKMLLLGLLYLGIVSAAPLRPTFTSCLDSFPPVAPSADQLVINDVLASIVSNQEATSEGLSGGGVQVLRLDLFGESSSGLQGYDNDTNKLATLFVDSQTASINVYNSASWVCNSLLPSPLPSQETMDGTYCPLSSGPFALNVSIPLYRSYALTTIRTQIRIVDTSETANTLACVNVQVTPYNEDGWYYGLFLWLPVALAIGFFVTTWGARFAAGWVVGSGVAEYEQKETALGRRSKMMHGKKEARMRKWGTMIISGLSGERLSVSGGLLRFVTPGLKDILHHLQFCTILGLIAVSWPRFAYPIFTQTAWASLIGNTSLVQGSDQRIDPYSTNYTAPANFGDQVSNTQSPLYLDESAFNPLLALYNRPNGIESFAFALGLRPQDLFGTCLAIFMMLAAAILIISLLLWSVHCLLEYASPPQTQAKGGRPTLGPSPKASYATKDTYDAQTPSLWDTPAPPALPAQHSIPERTGPSHARRIWWRFRPKGEAGAFHAAALYGNLLRLILIFHLPVTVFSIYQLVLGPRASIVSRVFAALAFVFISVLIPAGVMFKIMRTPSGKLYDATRTLLALGPMYNIYLEEKQMFRAVPLGASLAMGIVVGAGQGSGLAQAIILVLLELATLIAPAVWFPWDIGASMGAPHTFIAAIRTISMVLVMLLSSQLGMSAFTNQWLTYAIMLLQAVIFVFFLLMLLIKVVEGFIRLFGGVHFDESTHPLDGGLFGAIADLDCLNPKGGKAAERKRRKRGSKQLQRNVSAVGSLTTQMMLDRHSLGVMRPTAPHISPGANTAMSPSEFGSPSASDPPPSSYFPTYAPPLGPPPATMERRSSDEPYGAGGNIMDAWRPAPGPQAGYSSQYSTNQAHGRSQSTPLAWSPPQTPQGQGHGQGQGYPPSGFSVIRGGRSDVQNPYSVKAGTGAERSLTISPPPSMRVSQVSPKPTHSRQHSSTAIVENYDNRISPPHSPLYPPQSSAPYGSMQMRRPSGIKPNNQGLTPPVIAIPKRRSLNNLKDDSPTSQSDTASTVIKGKEKEKEAKKKKRRSWFKSGDESINPADADGDEEEEDDSDDEPGPSRRKDKGKDKSKHRLRQSTIPPPMHMRMKEPAPFEPVPTVLDYDLEDLDPARRKPQSSAVAGWKGMLGLKKKKSLDDIAEMARDENKARKAALAAESGAMLAGVPTPQEGRSFKVARRSAPGPTASSSRQPNSKSIANTHSDTNADTTPQEAPRSFRVKRGKVNQNAGFEDIPLSSVAQPVPTPIPTSSFKVHRPGAAPSPVQSPAPSSFVVNRSRVSSTPPLSPALPSEATMPPDVHSSARGKGKASMFQSGPGSRG